MLQIKRQKTYKYKNWFQTGIVGNSLEPEPEIILLDNV